MAKLQNFLGNIMNLAYHNGKEYRDDLIAKVRHRGYKIVSHDEVIKDELKFKNKKLFIKGKTFQRAFGENGHSGYVLRKSTNDEFRILPIFQQTSGTTYTKLVEQLQANYDETNLIVVYDGDHFTTSLVKGIKQFAKTIDNKNVQIMSKNGFISWLTDKK